jgi:predicted GH43/DUF377 family glycosyl hydrolase
VKDGRLVIEKVDGKYFMYWGENAVCAATSDNLTDWAPVLNENNELREIAKPRSGYFDSRLTECGPPAIKTVNGIVLLYNGKNGYKEERDPAYPAGAYCAGQFLFDANDPYKVLDRRDIEGKSYKEIADVLQLTEEQVKVNLFRARQRIKLKYSEIDNYGL